ncbi:disintegrin and metalloproteinase domain-containing protein 9 isoform X2 [Alligator mississippiensis]|uniref:disintegrin and metalloproteinase domain-containing protein 9 isoform X2 n=1 Tax=Alligator mississippiensis TaxID=8496 RepID=UPI0028773629|nr:disintegrin and metalloproteinase domain-containing protein 9 isoform X2 [Alligator mississippiensis]
MSRFGIRKEFPPRSQWQGALFQFGLSLHPGLCPTPYSKVGIVYSTNSVPFLLLSAGGRFPGSVSSVVLRNHRPAEAQDKVSYVIEIEGKEHTIHLEKNTLLLPKDFTVYSYNEEGKLYSENPDVRDHCHYQGYVEGIPDSAIAVSTCTGLRGLLHVGNVTYGIEPMDDDSDLKHIVYRLENVQKEPMVCGVSSTDPGREPTEYEQPPGMTQLLRSKRAVLHQTRYVELFIVVDKERYEVQGRSEAAVREEMVHLANCLDSMYIMLNIRVVLVGLEIWKYQNLISTDGSAGDVLANFVQWREKNLVTRRRHDSAQFVLKKGFGGTAGMAYVGTVCSKNHAGGINVFGQMSVQMFASIVAHELGHNLGMNHDDERECYCGADSCIMNSGASGSRNFSSCSAEDFEKLTLNKGGSCLLNVPRPDETYSVPFCGNKLVDTGEECDCGSPKECEKDPCCEAGTCRLRAGAECAYGDCCKNCRFLPGGTVCRASNNECDLPEYCNGTSQFCQQDFTVQNGYPCHNEEAYCYNGVCQYYNAQCQAIFGPRAKAAPDICFAEVNSKGDRFGNCGYHGNDYRKCSTWNAMCGKLQCENVGALPVFGIKPATIQTPIGRTTCWGVDFQLGSDVPDPGMVNEGTKCDAGKICRHYQCVSVSVLNYDCDVDSKCHGHGVCNNNRNCHCDAGWAPPYCDSTGYGGSIDSGPSYNDKDTSLRDGLLVFFFLVLPLLLLAVLAFARRNQLKQSCGRLISRCRSSHRTPPPLPRPPVETDRRHFQQSTPYNSRGVPTDVQANQRPVPAYSVNQYHQHYQPAYHQPYYHPLQYQEQLQQKLPTRPPPPQQGQCIPSRPAPLPPK